MRAREVARAVPAALSRPWVLAASGACTLLLGLLVFLVLIPGVQATCGAAPPDVRLYTSPREVGAFLSACGMDGRQAERALQLADLVYPAAMASFMAGALAALSTRAAPSGRWTWLWVVPVLSSVADYIENVAMWGALFRFPEAGPLDAVLGVASAAKQILGWAGGIALIALIVVLLVRYFRGGAHRRV